MGHVNPNLHPRFLRERLAEHLRQLRDQAGLSQGQAAQLVSWSLSKLQRIETGVVGISVTDTKALLDLYGSPDRGTVERLLAMAGQARRRDQFRSYRKFLTPEYQALLSYEDSASELRSVNAFIIPGLLQTPSYANALLSAKHAGEKLEALVKARQVRQEILVRDDGPRFVFIIDEGALHRHVGGQAVLFEQLTHLGQMAERPNVELRIIPFSAGAHLGLWELYTIMTIPGSPLTGEEAETIVYREAGDDEHIVRDDKTRIAQYETGFRDVLAQALGRGQTLRLIDRLKLPLTGSAAASSPIAT
jgi:transcriptional regulator with XRE-family HTH domain